MSRLRPGNPDHEQPAQVTTDPCSCDQLEAMATALERSGEYRILRKVAPYPWRDPVERGPVRRGLAMDLETTGLDCRIHEIIEIAMVPFDYTVDGHVTAVYPAYQAYNQPSSSIPPEITQLTGITDAMVARHVIDRAAVASFAAAADLVIAHNAGFDRKFCERLSDVFTTKAWACSQLEVNCAEEGFEGTKLGYLASHCGFFYDRHRAVNDCTALIEILRRPLPSGSPALSRLLQSARLPLWRVWAVGAPFDLKDVLKGRGYRWNGGEDGRPRAWHRDVPDDQLHAEKSFLSSEIFRAETHIPTVKMTAFDRYSERC